jgi:C4-type Zn-finger protein
MKEWFKCPVCGKKLCMIDTDKNIEGVYLKCPNCKQEVEVINKVNNTELGGRNPVPLRTEVRTQKPVSMPD